MRLIILHTYYQQPGGEDQIFAAEVSLLQSKGHEVIPFVLYNRDLASMPLWHRAMVTLWNSQVYQNLRKLIREAKPDVVHLHNTFPLASPAVIRAAKAEGLPVIMTLHNYRLLCPAATFFRNGRVCEDCLGKSIPWPGAIHGCWRGRGATAIVVTMLTLHRLLRTWEMVDIIIVQMSEFARQKFLESGLSPNKIVVKPNFVPDPGIGAHAGNYVLFVGRLSPEKGVGMLLKAWELLGGKVSLKIVGDGPLAKDVYQAARQMSGVEWLGRKAPEEVYALMGDAAFLVFPSRWYEGFPRTIVEAFACGLPVVASRLGAMAEIVEDGRTGLLFNPGDPEDLAAKVDWLLSHPGELVRMRWEARREYEEKYTPEKNYEMLMEIYKMAISRTKGRS